MDPTRRSLLTAVGAAVPLGLGGPVARAAAPPPGTPTLLLRSFEDSVRAAFGPSAPPGTYCRVEVGHSDLIRAGVQGCHNDRPFAGYPAGSLRIVRTGSEPGPAVAGVRFYVSTVDVTLVSEPAKGRPLDFRTIPPAPILG